MSASTQEHDRPSCEFVRKLVQSHAAIALEAHKDYLVESRLLPLARQRGLLTLRELVSQLRAEPFGDLHAQVIEAMTTNETSFFRDLHPFEALKKDVLPPLAAARATSKTISLWSAACSSGQEPYSIAILLWEHFPQLRDWKLQIYGSDLSRPMLDKAQRGVFSQLEVNRGLPAPLLVKYFQKSGLHWEIKPELRQLVRFERINLIQRWPPLPRFDVIFLRNVLIYFTAEMKEQVLANIRRQLAPDGALFLGGAETTLGIDDAWQRVSHGKVSSYRPLTTAQR